MESIPNIGSIVRVPGAMRKLYLNVSNVGAERQTCNNKLVTVVSLPSTTG